MLTESFQLHFTSLVCNLPLAYNIGILLPSFRVLKITFNVVQPGLLVYGPA